LSSTATTSNAVAGPATGLMVYNPATAGTSPNNVTPGFYYYDGSKWQRIINQQPDATVSFSTADPNTGSPTFDPPANAASKDYIYVSSVDNSQWTYNGTAYVTYTPPAGLVCAKLHHRCRLQQDPRRVSDREPGHRNDEFRPVRTAFKLII
jgi:hypothetical protein